MSGDQSDLIICMRSFVQKVERQNTAQDRHNEARLQLTESWPLPDTDAEVKRKRANVAQTWKELQTARLLADLSIKIAKDVLYPESPKLVQSENEAAA